MQASKSLRKMKLLIESSGAKVEAGEIAIPEFVTTLKIDVGLSGNAPQSKVWIDANPNLLVFGFEPLSLHLDMIANRASTWPVRLSPSRIGKNIFLLQAALSSKTLSKKQKLKITDMETGSSSLLDSNNLSQSTWEYVPVYKLDDFLDFINFTRFRWIEHLKIDAQGMDFEIVKGVKKNLRKICFVTIELDFAYAQSTNSSRKVTTFLALRGFFKIGRISSYLLRRIFDAVIEVDDPTYFNFRFFKNPYKKFFIYQKG